MHPTHIVFVTAQKHTENYGTESNTVRKNQTWKDPLKKGGELIENSFISIEFYPTELWFQSFF